MIGYTQCGPEVHSVAAEIFEAHHADRLRLSDGTFPRLCLMFVHGTDQEGEPPLKLHGYPAAAIVSVIPVKQRADKRADAEVLIDQSWWENASETQRRALLDHEITHLEIAIDDHGFVKTDDQGRPKLRLRLHDYQIGGFREIARRYGIDAPEVAAARAFEKQFGADFLSSSGLFAAQEELIHA